MRSAHGRCSKQRVWKLAYAVAAGAFRRVTAPVSARSSLVCEEWGADPTLDPERLCDRSRCVGPRWLASAMMAVLLWTGGPRLSDYARRVTPLVIALVLSSACLDLRDSIPINCLRN